MRLRSITAPNMPEGMRRVREQFGDDAIIVSTEETENGVLITAATERSELPEPRSSKPVAAGEIQAEPRVQVPPGRADELPSDQPQPTRAPRPVRDCLAFHGVPAALARGLVSIAEDQEATSAADALGTALDQVIGFSMVDPRSIRHPLMLVGDAGAGKTVVLAKLATQARLAGREVRTITTDTARAGGAEQLAAFMRAISVELHPVPHPQDLPRALGAVSPEALVLIDTPALNPLQPQGFPLREQIPNRTEPILVLPAGLQADDAGESAAALAKSLGIRRLIATRLDTARRYGAVVAAAGRGRISLAGFSDSRRIAEPVKTFDPYGLARMLLNQMAISLHEKGGAGQTRENP